MWWNNNTEKSGNNLLDFIIQLNECPVLSCGDADLHKFFHVFLFIILLLLFERDTTIMQAIAWKWTHGNFLTIGCLCREYDA